ncbi:MAG TPA: hypothetical protein VLV32_09560 [Burkholderiales bacterium]|nr:hypothetical protein [Burkholderiales bacterium]
MSNPQIHRHRNPSKISTDDSLSQAPGSIRIRRESGQALFVLLVLIVAVVVGLIVDFSSPTALAIQNDNKTARALAQAKDALIGWAISHPDDPGLLPYPDRNADGDYNGYSDCPPTSGNPALLLGELPYIGEKSPCQNPQATINLDNVDGTGENLWYAVSGNLVRGFTDPLPNIAANLSDATTTGWLTVRDANGAVLSNLVAFVVLSPGAIEPGQDRSGPAPAASNFLDNFTIGGTTYSNWDVTLGFVSAADTAKVPAGSNQFDDQLLFVTRDQYRIAIATRVAGELKKALNQYYSSTLSYPFAAPNPDGECVSGSVTGYIPSQDTIPDCGGALAGLPAWFPNWESYVTYTLNNPASATLTIFGRSFAVTP